MALLDDLLNPVRTAFVNNRIALAEAAQQRREYDEAKQLIDESLLVLPQNQALLTFRRANEQAEARFRNASPGTDVAARLQELKKRQGEVTSCCAMENSSGKRAITIRRRINLTGSSNSIPVMTWPTIICA